MILNKSKPSFFVSEALEAQNTTDNDKPLQGMSIMDAILSKKKVLPGNLKMMDPKVQAATVKDNIGVVESNKIKEDSPVPKGKK